MFNGSLRNNVTKDIAIKCALTLAGLLVLSLVIYSPYIPENIQIEEGQTAETTLLSPRFIEFQSTSDKLQTKALRKERLSLVKDIYSTDESITKEVLSNIISTFTTIKEHRKSTQNISTSTLPEDLKYLNKRQLKKVTTTSEKNLSSIEYFTYENAKNLLQEGLTEINTANIKTTLTNNLRILGLDNLSTSIIYSTIIQYIVPNKLYDEAQTLQAKEKEIESIKPFTTIIKEGRPIIYKGETVSKKHIEALKALNIYGAKANAFKFIGIVMLTFLGFLLIERFIYHFNFRIGKRLKNFVLIYFVIAIVVVLARSLQNITIAKQAIDMQFLVPISIASMIISVLLTPNLSLLIGTVTSVYIALMYQADYTLFCFLFFSNCTATFSMYYRYKRTDLIQSGYIVGLANVVFVLAVGLFKEAYDILWFSTNMGLGFFNGILSAMISFAILPYLEDVFKITTSQTLLELSNLNHPLLKRMMLNAPGTYQHSLMVANLAEAAAEEIGADPILTRVGAYYHDIGKIKRPMFFTENQFREENPHNTLSARMSKIIIASHVKEGIDIAKKYKLPTILHDFILEHHGTQLVSFFYTQAIQEDGIEDNETNKEEFRYPGPKPRSKETGILMFADSVEAAMRSLDKPTPAKIESLIDKIFKAKLDDNQLENCPLNFKEIYEIKQTFLRVFKSIYHNRLNYQEELAQIIEQTKK